MSEKTFGALVAGEIVFHRNARAYYLVIDTEHRPAGSNNPHYMFMLIGTDRSGTWADKMLERPCWYVEEQSADGVWRRV